MKNFKFTIPTIVVAVGASLIACIGLLGITIFQPEHTIPTTPNSQQDVSTFLDKISDSDKVNLNFNNIDIKAEAAVSPEKQANGLMNRTSLGENSGMLFIFKDNTPRTFWMKDTLISLDIIFLDPTFRVVNIAKNTKPNQTTEVYPSQLSSKYVLEMNGGWSEKHDLQIGDVIDLK